MSVKYTDLKKWSKEFGIGKFGESKKDLIKNLKKYMKDNVDDLDEDQREWYSEQIGEKVEKKSKKKKEKKEKVEPKAKKKKKKKEEEPEEEEGVQIKAGKDALKEYAKELDIDIKGHKKFDLSDWEELANKVYAEVDDMDDDDREELSKELFAFYTTIRGQQDDVPEEKEGEILEVEVPKKIQLKRWSAVLGVKTKGKEPEEIAVELLEEFKDVDEDDKKELPDSLVEWASGQLGVEVEEEVVVEVESVTLPDYATLKGFCREVGFKLKDIKKADKHPPTLVEMILDAYESGNDDYSEELVEFVEGMAPVEEGEPELVEEEIDTSVLVGFLVEAGYPEDKLEDWTADQLVAKLVEDYGDKDDREDLPEESIEFLQEVHPELFEKKKVKKKKKKKL